MTVEDSADYIPTEQEIAQRCLEIQSRWSEEERLSRMVGNVCLMKSRSANAAPVEDHARRALAAKLADQRESKAASV